MLRAIVDKQTILNPLVKIQTVVDKKTTMHLLNNVLITTNGDKLVLEATDLEISYKGEFPAEIEEHGEITVNARRFYEIVKELPTDQFLLEQLPEEWIRINIGEKGEYKLGGLPTDNFPRFTFFEKVSNFELEPAQLRNLLKKTVIAVSTDESKYALTGLLFEVDGETGKLRTVGSDSHRLNLKEIRLDDEDAKTDISIIIPRKGVLEMIKILESPSVIGEEGEKKAVLSTDNKFILLTIGDEHLNIRLLDGSYPDYKLILPEERIRFLYFDRKEMLSVFKRVSIVSPDPDIKSVRATFRPDEAIIESFSKESSDAKEKLPIEYEGEEFQIALNARYMIETLGVMESDKIRLTLNDDESPCILEGDNDPGFLALIMPMTLEE